jgi:hypothetical protein
MNATQLEQTLQGAILNLFHEDSANPEQIAAMTRRLFQREWIDSKFVQYLKTRQRMESLNPTLNSVELDELAVKRFLEEIDEELRAEQ